MVREGGRPAEMVRVDGVRVESHFEASLRDPWYLTNETEVKVSEKRDFGRSRGCVSTAKGQDKVRVQPIRDNQPGVR